MQQNNNFFIIEDNPKRPRAVPKAKRAKSACTSCRKSKKRCVRNISGKNRCERCEKHGKECIYATGCRPRISRRSNGSSNGNPAITGQADLQSDHNDIGVIDFSDQYLDMFTYHYMCPYL
ncbi:20863_t:CDS:2 [Cetraspora pellucida]|uniref:20863_t:CDS:1 n=1 Tax=Cetraspora pellucida TaxID=1433469 RepID=A0A9N9GIN0_9GLOM|nr:20863_t:CDS:2 [Cetraspora pellucida]